MAKVTAKKATGPECPRCGCVDFRKVSIWKTPRGRYRIRWECKHCGKKVTTFENAEVTNG